MATDYEVFDVKKLNDFALKALMKVGVPEEDAKITADILIATDLRGIDSHGIAHLGMYVGGLKEGRTNPDPKTEIISQAPATAIMDGDKGLGFVVGHRAMNEAIRRAGETGAGFVSVRPSLWRIRNSPDLRSNDSTASHPYMCVNVLAGTV